MANDALFEIGLEELPARFIDDAEKQFYDATVRFLQEKRLTFKSVQSYSTPRRLAVLVNGLAETQMTVEEEVKGPAVKIARDDQDEWTKAAIGFTKGQGLSVEDIYIKDVKETSYVFVNKRIEGSSTLDILPALKTVIESIQFNKNMRWGNGPMRYARPIRWLVALYGSEVIPFEIAGVQTDRYTYGHRFLGNKIELNRPEDYVPALADQYVIVKSDEREHMIMRQIRDIVAEEGFQVPVDQELLAEVKNLVEYPTIFKGRFDRSFLKLPADILITSMKEHQRYFPVKDAQGNLLPLFIGVRNGDGHALETVAKGNEKVLKARLADAQFFYEEDIKTPLARHLEKLERVVFQEKLGTLADKVSRVKQISEKLSDMINLEPDMKLHVQRAAEISKFDLMTQMVNEFTELQGIMGEDYALKYGEHAVVATAVREHYLPKGAQDTLPDTIEGAVLSVADKLDTVTGSITAGLKPSASQDPYGLRRQATGILRILESRRWPVTLEALLDTTMKVYEQMNLDNVDTHPAISDVRAFFHTRAAYLLRDQSIEPDVVQAVIHDHIGTYAYTTEKAHILSEKRHDPQFKQTQEALVRVLNIAKKAENLKVDPEQLHTPSEKDLYDVFEEVRPLYQTAKDNIQAGIAFEQLEKLADPIHAFFENNMVMTDDREIRSNRLALMYGIASLISDFADLSVVEWKQQF